MPWSQQNVQDAIGEAKRKNAIFVVYIEDDSGTASLEHIIQEPEVSDLLSTQSFIAVRIGSSSQSYTYFTNIYQIVPVPSLFFIGRSGWPLEIITTELPVDSVIERVRRLVTPTDVSRVLEEPSSSVTTSAGASIVSFKTPTNALCKDMISVDSETSVVTETPAPLTIEESTTTQSVSLTSFVASPSASVASVCPPEISSVGASKKAEEQNASQREIKEDKVATTSHKIAEHEEFQEKTVQNEQSKKSDLGASGSTTHNQIVNMNSERNEKESEPIVKTGIESSSICTSDDTSQPPASSANVIDKDINPGSHVRQRHDPQSLSKSTENQYHPPASGILDNFGVWMRNVLYGGRPTTLRASQNAEGSGVSANCIPSVYFPDGTEGNARWPEQAQIQFRLPDGSTHSETFSSNTTMAEVREYVRNSISFSFRVFSLATSYPRLEFTNVHNTISLGALGLAPRSVILIIPGSQVSEETAWSVSNVWTLILWPFSAIYSLYTLLHLRLFGGDPAVGGTSSTSSLAGSEQSSTSQPSLSRNISSTRRRTPTSSTIQREGNVHRLSNRQDESDEDNNTYNGNSTQQM